MSRRSVLSKALHFSNFRFTEVFIQVGPRHYELILSPDINELRAHHQWFYFQVSNNEKDVDYTFEIINFIKKKSMFNRGLHLTFLFLEYRSAVKIIKVVKD